MAKSQVYDFEWIGLEEGLPSLFVSNIVEGDQGFFWLSTEGAGLVRYDGYDFLSLKNNKYPVISNLQKDNTGNLWFLANGTWVKYDGFTFTEWPTDSTLPIFESTKTEGNYSYNKQGFLADTLGGFQRIDYPNISVFYKNDSVCLLKNDVHQWVFTEFSEPKLNVKSVFVSSEGYLLIVTNKGLLRPRNMAFGRYKIPSGQVYAMAQYKSEIVVGTTNGVAFLDGVANKQLEGLGLVFALAEFEGMLAIGSEKGLFLYDNAQLKKLPLAQGQFVFSLYADGNELWIGTGDGIYCYTKGRVSNISKQKGLSIASIFSIKKAEDESIWFGSYTQGFFKYYNDKWSQITEFGNLNFDSDRFSAFYPINTNELWLATLNNGLYHLKGGTTKHYDFSTVDYAEISAIENSLGCDDDQASIWMGTNKGILALQDIILRNEESARHRLTFMGSAGSPNVLVCKNGQLWQGTSSGVEVLDVCAYLKNKKELLPEVKQVSVLSNDENLNAYAQDSVVVSNIPVNPALPHNYNYIEFNYGVRTLVRPEDVLYRYRLADHDENWTFVAKSRQAIFTDLQPGNYTLEIQARRTGAPWQAESASYSFSIRRPFWETWWFIGLVVLALGGATAWFIYDRLNKASQRLQLQNQLMEMERKALRLQMNPHFIFNALDSISSFIFKQDPKQAVRYLNNFAKLMRLTLESSMEHLHPVETEVSILKNYLELEKLRFSDKFDYQINLDEDLDYDIGLPPMLIQPHVENAILHGLKPRKEKGLLKINFELKGEFLQVIIDDNGIGRKKAKELPSKKDHRSMATQINKDRLRLLKNSKNSEIELEITDKYNEQGEPLGTRVSIKLPAEEI